MAIPSTEEILAQGGGSPVVIDGVLYQPIFDSTGQGETFEQGPLTQILAYKQGETDPGKAYKTYSPTMQEVGTGQFKEVGNFGDLLTTAAEDLAPLAAMALTAGGAGGALGGFLSGGALTGTGASALGNALISGTAGAISGQDPLKAALLAAGGTYAGGLFGGAEAANTSTLTDAQFIAADAAQLAGQGLGADQIEQVLRASGVNATAAIGAADAATSGLSVDQIANEITLGNRGLFTDTAVTTAASPTTVSTDASGLQTVTTTGTNPGVNAGGLLGGLAAAVPSAVTTQPNLTATDLGPLADQQVTVTGSQQPNTTNDNLAAAIAATVNPAAVTTGAATTVNPADQVVDVTGTAKPQQNIGDVAAVINAGTLYGPKITGAQTSAYDKVLEQTGSKTEADTATTLAGSLSISDILKALTSLSSLGLLSGGGGGGGGTAVTPMAPTTPVPVGNADYYKAIQQYYNTYMPQTPRDVATPLQQWYEGKFGG
jgi:hypothetical protein